MAFKAAGHELRFEGSEQHEAGIDVKSGKTLVRVNPSSIVRPRPSC